MRKDPFCKRALFSVLWITTSLMLFYGLARILFSVLKTMGLNPEKLSVVIMAVLILIIMLASFITISVLLAWSIRRWKLVSDSSLECIVRYGLAL